MARSTKKPVAAPAAPSELLVCINKTEKAISNINALTVPVVVASEVVASDNVKAQLCLNIMAGHVDKTIIEAHAKKGGLKRLFTGMANAEANALRVCLDAKPEALVKGWAAYTAQAKRVRNISLQALAKTVRAPSDKSDKVTLREAIMAWCADEKNQAIMNGKTFPQSLYDIFAEYDLTADGEDE